MSGPVISAGEMDARVERMIARKQKSGNVGT
jgi:antitoxin ParD1/3/4